jgi:Protein of unknown function (DUF3592)
MDALLEYLLKAIVYAFHAAARWLRVCGSREWPSENATVTAPPTSSSGVGCPTVEIVYSYRLKGELYTGIHEEPFLLTDSLTDYVERFGEGNSVVVRVKPGNPETSVVREGDQGALTVMLRN